MNIYELEKRAFRPHAWEPLDREAVDLLAKHSRNNFMKALEALKHLNDACRGNGAAMYDELIAELEEVNDTKPVLDDVH